MKRVLWALLSVSIGLHGCGDGGDEITADASGADASLATMPVTIRFRPKVGNAVWQCGQTYQGLGTSNTTYRPSDFRMYVSEVNLVDSVGAKTAVAITNDGRWQKDGVVLLDFENATGECNNNVETNDAVIGTVPPGNYSGVEFKVGVPFAQNHIDQATAAAPLNVTSLWWGWNGGFIFLKIDGKTTGLPNGTLMHLGSTGCVESSPNVVTSCSAPNRTAVTLSNFNPQTNVVVADLSALVATSNLDANISGPPGCMSGPTDPDCAPLLLKLGIGTGNPTQSFFRVE